MADPATWAAIGTYIVENWVAITVFVASTAYSYDQQRRQRQRARQQYNKSLRDRLIMVDLDVNSPRSICYGRVRAVEGVRRRFTSGEHAQHLTLIVSFAGHQIDGFERFYFNDKELELDEDGWVQTKPYVVGKRKNRSVVLNTASPTYTVTESNATLIGATASGQDDGDNGTPLFMCSISGQTLTVEVTPGYTGPLYVSYQVRKGESKARIRTYLGTDSQNVGADLASEYPDQIKSTDRYAGIALAVIDLLFDEDVYTSGIPNVTALFRGKQLLDPRTGTIAWTENPALIAYDYARHPNGFDVTAGADYSTTVPTVADTIAAANACDVQTTFRVVTQSGRTRTYELPRYRCGIQVSTDTDPKSAMNEIMESMAGRWGWAGGSLRFRAGVYSAPVATMTPEWIMQPLGEDGELPDEPPVKLYNGVPRESKINMVTGTFVDPNDRWQPGDFPAVKDEPAIAADGAEYPQEVEFQGVNHIAHAAHLASVMIRKNEAGLRGQFSCGLAAYKLEIFDAFAADLPRFFGSLNKTFEVTGWRWSPGGGVVIDTEEITAALYTPNYSFKGKDPAPDSRLPSPWDVPDIAGLHADSGTEQLIVQADGTVTTRVKVAWDRIQDQSVYLSGKVEIRWGRLSEHVDYWQSIIVPGDQTSTYILGARDRGRIGIVARAINSVPVNGDWTDILSHTVVGKSAPPSNVLDFRYRLERFGIRLKWDDVEDADLRYYEVRERASEFTDGALIVRTRDTDYLWEVRAVGSYQVSIKARDRSGNYSTSAAHLTVTVAPPGPPRNLTARYTSSELVLDWDPPAATTAQIVNYEVRKDGVKYARTLASKLRIVPEIGAVPQPETWSVAAVAAPDELGEFAAVDVEPRVPGQVRNLSARVWDNNALLSWLAPNTGTLEVKHYEVRRGNVYASSKLVGFVNGTFASQAELVKGTYKYWVTAIDKADNPGPVAFVVCDVNEPPDFEIQAEFVSEWSGTKTGTFVEDGSLLGPSIPGQTWDQSFTAGDWTTLQQQIDAGHTLFFQPGGTGGTYVETFDTGVAITQTTVNVAVQYQTVAGSATLTTQVSYRATTSDAWVDMPVGELAFRAVGCRYIRVTLTMAGSGGDDLIKVSSLTARASVKRSRESMSFACAAADVNGTYQAFTKPYLDVESITATPRGSSSLSAVVNFDDVASPAGFRVMVFNQSGARTSATVDVAIVGFLG